MPIPIASKNEENVVTNEVNFTCSACFPFFALRKGDNPFSG